MPVQGRPRKYHVRMPQTDEPLFLQMGALWNHYINTGAENSGKTRERNWGYFQDWLRRQLRLRKLDLIDSLYAFVAQAPRDANLLVDDYKKFMFKKRKLSPKTVNSRISDLATLIKTARRLGLCTWRLEVTRLRVQRYGNVTGPRVEDLYTVLAHLNQTISGNGKKKGNRYWINKAIRDKAIFSLYYPLGLRPHEIYPLKVSAIDVKNKQLTIRGKARDEAEVISIPDATMRALTAWLDVRGRREGVLFREAAYRYDKATKALSEKYVSELIIKLGEEIGIPMTPRGLRHTAITEVLKVAQKMGYPIEDCLKFSRHKSIEVILAYRDRIENRQGEFANAIGEPMLDMF